jgi:cytochrome c-type biogenesis protein CcmE
MSDDTRTPATPAPRLTTDLPARRRPRRKLFVWGATLLILGTMGFMVKGGLDENIVYFLTPTELLAKGTDGFDTPVRLGGQVVPNSVKWNAEKLDLSFRVTDGKREVAVHSKGAPPQMFAAGIGVVLEGRYAKSGTFESTTLMV